MSLPPGPRLPSTAQTFRWVMRPTEFMEDCRNRYGDTFTVRLRRFDQPAVFISDPASIKTVFTADPSAIPSGTASDPGIHRVMGPNSLLALDGEHHLRQRRLLLPAFHGQRLAAFGDWIEERARRDVADWPRGEAFALRPRMQEIALDTILQAIFGIEGSRSEVFRRELTRLLNVISPSPQGLLFPFRKLRMVWATSRRLATVDRLLYEEIDRRRRDSNLEQRRDVMSMLLGAHDEEGNPISDREVRDALVTLLLTGHDTASTALAWTFILLLHNPEALKRLQAELATGESEYLTAVIDETLRLRPLPPIATRKLAVPLELDGYSLPAGVFVVPAIYLAGTRAATYPDPYAFRPERFLGEQPDTYSWIPFGGGTRRCLGASFALFEMKIVLRTLIPEVRLRPAMAEPERPRWRNITLAPERDALVRLDGVGSG